MKKLFFTLVLISLATLANSQEIILNGAKSNWSAVSKISDPVTTHYVKVTQSTSKNAGIVKLNSLQAYIDADRSTTTGYLSSWLYPSAGVDYIIMSGINYFNNIGSQSNWTFGISSSPMNYAYGVSFGEVGLPKTSLINDLSQPKISKIPLSSTIFGLGFPYDVGVGESFLPSMDWGFNYRNIYCVKPRLSFPLAGNGHLLWSNAYYHPFMFNVENNQFLDFESGTGLVQNQLLWASWAIDLDDATKYDVKITRKCDDNGSIQFSLIDMATNLVVKDFPDVTFHISAVFAEESLGQLDFTNIPSGKYMLRMKTNSAWPTFLKVQNLTFVKSQVADNKEIVFNNVRVWSQSNSLVVQSDKLCDVVVYTLLGAPVAERKNIITTAITLQKGLYLVLTTHGGQKKIDKILIN
jgi:hypothetical protein